jgi:hypothetical protein
LKRRAWRLAGTSGKSVSRTDLIVDVEDIEFCLFDGSISAN